MMGGRSDGWAEGSETLSFSLYQAFPPSLRSTNGQTECGAAIRCGVASATSVVFHEAKRYSCLYRDQYIDTDTGYGYTSAFLSTVPLRSSVSVCSCSLFINEGSVFTRLVAFHTYSPFFGKAS